MSVVRNRRANRLISSDRLSVTAVQSCGPRSTLVPSLVGREGDEGRATYDPDQVCNISQPTASTFTYKTRTTKPQNNSCPQRNRSSDTAHQGPL